MGKSIETAICIPIILIVLCVFVLQGPKVFSLFNLISKDEMGFANPMIEAKKIYEVIPSDNPRVPVTSPARMVDFALIIKDVGGQMGGLLGRE